MRHFYVLVLPFSSTISIGHCASPIYSSTVSEPGYGFVEPGEIIDQDFEMISSSSTSSLTNSPIRAFHQQNKNKPQRITVKKYLKNKWSQWVRKKSPGKKLVKSNKSKKFFS